MSVCHLVVVRGNARVLELLLAMDALAVHSACDHQLRTPLHWAALLGRAQCAQMLCEKGAIVRSPSRESVMENVVAVVSRLDGRHPAALRG